MSSLRRKKSVNDVLCLPLMVESKGMARVKQTK